MLEKLYYQLFVIVSHLPMFFLRFIAKAIVYFENLFHCSKTANYIKLNLKIALPELSESQRNCIIKQAILNEVQSYFEFFHIWGATNQSNIKSIHQIYGAEYFHQALAKKQGVILIVPHFGTWEVMNAWCAQFTKMTILYKPIKNKIADQFVRNARSKEQAHLVPTNENGVKEIFKALKKGETTVILPDHSPHIESEMVDYFGIPLYSSQLTAKLAQKTKATTLFLYAKRNDSDGFDMYIEPMPEQIYQGTALDATKIIHEKIENLIRLYPEHYHWSYKRFKANPMLDNIYQIKIEDAITLIKNLKKM